MRRRTLIGTERERGAALVEFALLLPVFMTLVLGMFSGGIAYNQNLSINHAAREGSRFGATLSKASPGGLVAADWTAAVRNKVVETATGELGSCSSPSTCTFPAGHYVCVALVKPKVPFPPPPAHTNFGSPAYAAVFGDTASATADGVTAASGCYDDGLNDTYLRVHVAVGRPGKIETIFWSRDLTLTSRGTARFEGA